MRMPTRRMAFAALLLLVMAPGALAQQPGAPARPTNPPAAPAPLATSDLDARATKEQLRELMQRFPPDIGRIIKMDPTLIQNEAYLAQYPALASFLAMHPEVAH